MPLYDYECAACGHIQEEFKPYEDREGVCVKCGKQTKRIVSAAKLDIFKEQAYEELGDDAPVISSKQHLARECAKRGLASRMLMEGYHNYGRRREI